MPEINGAGSQSASAADITELSRFFWKVWLNEASVEWPPEGGSPRSDRRPDRIKFGNIATLRRLKKKLVGVSTPQHRQFQNFLQCSRSNLNSFASYRSILGNWLILLAQTMARWSLICRESIKNMDGRISSIIGNKNASRPWSRPWQSNILTLNCLRDLVTTAYRTLSCRKVTHHHAKTWDSANCILKLCPLIVP